MGVIRPSVPADNPYVVGSQLTDHTGAAAPHSGHSTPASVASAVAAHNADLAAHPSLGGGGGSGATKVYIDGTMGFSTSSAVLAFFGTTGTDRVPAVLFDGGIAETFSFWTLLPETWVNFSIKYIWANTGAGAGNVIWEAYRAFVGAGELTTKARTTTTAAAAAAGAQYERVTTTIVASTPNTPGVPLSIVARRSAASAGDTLDATDAALLMVLLEQVA